jgi:hypothetical protein
MQDSTFRIQNSGSRIQQDSELRIQSAEFGIELIGTLGSKTPDSG